MATNDGNGKCLESSKRRYGTIEMLLDPCRFSSRLISTIALLNACIALSLSLSCCMRTVSIDVRDLQKPPSHRITALRLDNGVEINSDSMTATYVDTLLGACSDCPQEMLRGAISVKWRSDSANLYPLPDVRMVSVEYDSQVVMYPWRDQYRGRQYGKVMTDFRMISTSHWTEWLNPSCFGLFRWRCGWKKAPEQIDAVVLWDSTQIRFQPHNSLLSIEGQQVKGIDTEGVERKVEFDKIDKVRKRYFAPLGIPPKGWLYISYWVLPPFLVYYAIRP